MRTGPNATGPWTTIVGVIGDIRHGGLEEVPQPELYISYLQGPPVAPFIVLRTTGDPALLAETVRAEARRIDKNLPLYDMRTMTTLRSEAVSTRRFILLIVGAFGVLALGLAAIGVYGVMSLIVSERTREVGVRLALGAEPSQLLRMIVGQAAKLAGIGVVIGLVGALPLAPLLDSQLYGIAVVRPDDVRHACRWSLLVIAALAAVVPARKAMRIDPLAACGSTSRRQSPLLELAARSVHQAVELCRHSSHGLGLAEIDAGALEQRHRVIRAARLQQLQIAIDRRPARRRIAAADLLHQLRRRRKARRVLIDVVRRLEEVRNARPGVLRARIGRQRVAPILGRAASHRCRSAPLT